jgi:hypothetical protein
MDQNSLQRANFLWKNIQLTETACKELESIHIETNPHFCTGIRGDGLPNFVICKHTDGSGWCADLFRGEGNIALLGVIKTELKRQLEEMKKEFNSL